MSKIISLFLFVTTLLLEPPSFADDSVHHVGFDETSTHFLIGHPPGWTYNRGEAPFHAKFVNHAGTHECYVMVNACRKNVDKNDLVIDCLVAGKAICENEFFENDNYQLLFIESTHEYASMIFTYFQNVFLIFTYHRQEKNSQGMISFVLKTKGTDLQMALKGLDMLQEVGPYIQFFP